MSQHAFVAGTSYDVLPVAIVAFERPSGRIVTWNAAAEALLGKARHAVIGEALAQALPALASCGAPASPGAKETHAFDAVGPDGRKMRLEATVRADGQLVIAVLHDITAHAMAQPSRNGQLELADLASDAVVIVDLTDPEHDTVLYWNSGAERMYGWSREEMLGRCMTDTVTTEFPEPNEAIREKLAATGSWEGELIQTRRDGTLVVAETHMTLQCDSMGRRRRLLAISTDVTARRQAEEDMRLARQQLEFVLKASPVVTYMVEIHDGQWHPQWMTENVTRLLGYTVEEALAPTWWFHGIHPDDLAIAQTPESELIPGRQHTVEYRLRHKDGHYVWVNGENRVLQGPGCLLVVGALSEITARKKAEALLAQSNAQLADSQRIAQLGSWEYDLATWEVSWSDELYRIFGLSPEETPSYQGYLARVHPDDRASIERAVEQAVEDGQPFAIEQRIIRPDGTIRYVRGQGAVIRDPVDGSRRMIGTTLDVTRQQHILAELEQAKEHAEAASTAKSMFLANMSHELRTPLNAVIGYAEMLQEEAEDRGYAGFAPDLQKIHLAGKQLLGLINDILDLSKIEAGKMTVCLEDFELATLVGEVASTVQPLVERKQNVLELRVRSGLPPMHTDAMKVRQCLTNLLSNACKFTHQGHITLEVLGEERDGQAWITLSVTDTGIGMSEAQLGMIFQEFTQADASTTRQYGGTGLGLSITTRLLAMLGGSIAVTSQPGHGSTFTMRLPARLEQPAADGCPALA